MGVSFKRKHEPAEKGDPLPDAETGQPEVKPAPFHALFRGADALDYVLMIVGTVGAMAIGASLPIFSILFGDILNTIGSPGSLMDQISETVLYILYVGAASFVGGYFQSAFWSWTAQRQVRRLREQYLRSALGQNVEFFDVSASTGGLLQSLSSDALIVQKLLGDKMGLTIYNCSMALTGVIIGFVYSWDITLVVLALMPLLAVAGALLGRMTTNISAKQSEAYKEANACAQDSLSNIRTVTAFNMQDSLHSRYVTLLDKPAVTTIQQGVISGSILAAFNISIFSAWGIGLYYGAVASVERGYTPGDVLAAFVAVVNGGFGLGQALPALSSFADARSAIARLLQVIDKQPAYNASTPGKQPQQLTGQIELQSVTFSYPSRPGTTIVKGLSLTIEATQRVALVGGSGSGKSTIIALIQRWYDPLEGRVLVDGVDIRDLHLGWLRAHMGLVSQEPTLFATSIRENIAFGRKGASQQEVEDAAKSANIHKFIMSLPGGYDSLVGERGVQLSGGQKQRVAIARAILRSPKVLLLDEATSALDAASERVVQATLDKVMVGRTTVVVAHRLSTVRDADKICVVRQGVIVEEGTHQQLLGVEGGAYQALIKLQNLAGAGELDANVGLEDDDAVLGLATAHSDQKPQEAVGKGADADADASAAAAEKLPWWKKLGGGAKKAEEGKEGGDKEPEAKVSMVRLMKEYNKPELPLALPGIIAAGVAGMAMPAVAILMSEAITSYFIPDKAARLEESLQWLWIFIVCGVGVAVASYFQMYLFGIMGSKLSMRVRQALMRKLLYQDVGWFDDDKNNSAALVSRLGTDALHVKGAVGDSLAVTSAAVISMTFALTWALVLSWKLALVILACTPMVMVAGIIQMRFATQQGGESDEALAASTQTASEAFQAIRTVQAYGMEGDVVEVYHSQQSAPVKAAITNAHIGGIGFGYSMFCIMGVYGLAFWYGGKLVTDGEISFNAMLKTIFLVLMSSIGITQAQAAFPDLGKAQAAVQNVFKTMDRQPVIDASSGEGVVPKSLHGSVSLKDVVFAYPSRPTLTVFNGFSLDIPAGKQVAVVGESGSGKSTIISFVLRWYDPQSGSVLIDGVDVRQYNLKALRSQIGLVQQEPILFNTTIRENILMGRPDASQEELEEAAKAANAHSFITGTADGYNTRVGERGGQLSGGQKQRIAIARAVLRNPRILLLDEATSALDATSEAVVQEALDSIMEGRTTIVVAHRLSTVRNADRICVVQTGVIVEQGTHEELVARNGAYAALVKAQMRSQSRNQL